jgi:hypothetical protein
MVPLALTLVLELPHATDAGKLSSRTALRPALLFEGKPLATDGPLARRRPACHYLLMTS